MKLNKILLATAITLTTSTAFANWQPYVAVDAGLSQGTYNNDIGNPYRYQNDHPVSESSSSAPYNFSANITHAIPQIRIGISNQYNKYYVGFDADVAYNSGTYTPNPINEEVTISGNPDNTFSNQVSATLHWQYTLATELGYFVTPKLMPYARLGISAAEANTDYSYIDLPGGSANNPVPETTYTANSNAWLFGPTIGLGAQYSITQNIRSFAEFDYTYLMSSGSVTGSASITPWARVHAGMFSSIPEFNQNISFTSWTGIVGLGYYF